MMDMLQSDSDWDSFSDSASSDGTEELDFLYGREAHSIFSSLEESIGKIDDFLSFERGYIHGDIVSSVADPSGQMGRVTSVKMFVDLESTHGRIIRDVDSEILLKIRSISVGDYVVHGPWIGKVEKVVDFVTVVLDDGTTCDVIALDPERLLPISSNLLEDSAYPYYPGQRVQVRLSAVTKSARWLCGTRKENQDAGTVSAVEAGLVYVDWRACALVGCDLSLPSPPRLQDAKNLTLLSCFSHEYWQLGDWCMLPMSGCKGMKDQMLLNASTLELIEEHKNIGRGFKREEFGLNSQELFVIVKTKATIDVVWQDGGCSLGLDSQALLPINVVNPHEFWPGQFVIEKGTSDDPRASGSKKWGVVNAVDAKERTVKVTWKSCEVNRSNDGDSAQMVETVSAYELVEDPDYSFCYGDVVFKNVGQVVKNQANMEAGLNNNTALKGEDCQKELFTYSSKDYLLSIGCVTGFINGAVEVVWASGLKTKVSPSDIFRADKYEDQTMTSQQHEQNVEEVNGEMIDYAKQVSSLKGDLLNSNGVSEEKKVWPQESSSSFLPQCSIGFFKSMATSIFGSFGSTSLSCPISHGSISEDENAANTPKETGMLEMCDPCPEMQNHEMVNLKAEANDFQETTELRSSCANENRGRFLQFDIVGDCSDHHFLDGTGKGLTSSQKKRGWLKKVQQEWNVLEKDLPESIYVRVYEEKMELLRAAIIGAPGTPYHDGLFFFDIYLPPEYPHEPPLVYYRSGGLRVNPNLYESGKVCLSLLNTWTGTGSEVWNPESSSILQVLLSLQALVLNEKPYFNEAGYDKQMGRAEGERNSVSYNENAYLMTWKSMLYLLRQPPKHFDTLVEEHLTRRSQHILMACKAYMEGAPLAFESGNLEQGNPNGGSTGFKLMLTKLVPKLVEAFSERGIDCSWSVAPRNEQD